MSKDKSTEQNDMESTKENQDYQNMPESSPEETPADINKKDIEKASELNEEGKTDNTDKH